MVAQPLAQRVVEVEELVVHWVVGDLNVALAGDCVQELEDRLRVLPTVNVPDGAVLGGELAELVIVQQQPLVLLIRIVLALVEAHVDHHVHRVRYVAVQVGVPTLFGCRIHPAPTRVPPVRIVHLRPKVGRNVLAWKVLGEVEHAVAVRVLRDGERLHQVLKVLRHLALEVLVRRPVFQLEHHTAEGIGAKGASPGLEVAREKVGKREPVHRLAIPTIDHLDLLGPKALQEATRRPRAAQLVLHARDHDRLAAPPALLEVDELARRVRRGSHADRRARKVHRWMLGHLALRRQLRHERLDCLNKLGELLAWHLDGALVHMLVRRLRLLLLLLHVVAP